MNLLLLPGLAIKALSRNKLRSGLTSLGIIIGVSAVICVVAIGEGATATVERAIANIGMNMVWVEAGGVNRNGVRTGNGQTRTLTLGDYDAIRTRIPLVTNVTPQADTGVQLIYGNQNWHSSVRGIGPAYLDLKNWKVVRGDMFTDQDVNRASNVCVLGQTIVDQLFGDDQDPLGEIIRVNNEPCKVLGVLEVRGQSATGQDQDDNLLMPYSTVMKKIKGQAWLDDIMCSARSANEMDQAEQDIASLIRERHHIAPDAPDDFNLRHPTEIAEAVKASTRTMETLLAAIASVSLLVGGVGIMNIMLVSVTERTREIGLRMAVGARARDVLRQFLLEAVLLSVLGGAVGVATGMFGVQAIAKNLHWPTHVSTNAIWVAFGVAAAIGITFGYYPAVRAARLDPIEALRVE
ncbi:MAG TPA: ABC transporter permease [Vicinamibacterales bacterium]|jgi:putative ABC transport system permease protein|nr:ABC transporter permease [Vicinamibacterales bacterium]